MTDIDSNKLHLIDQAIGWLQNAKKYHAAWQHEVAGDCLKKARATLNDPIFDRKPIPGFARNEQPETVKIVSSSPLGFSIVNSCDYDPETMQLYKEPTPSKRK